MIKGGGVHIQRGNFYNSITSNDFEDAFYKFIENATFKILTDGSISGLTLTATLKDGIESPYVSVNPDSPTFMEDVRKILIKIMPSLPPRVDKVGKYYVESRRNLNLKRDQVNKVENYTIQKRIDQGGTISGGIEVNSTSTIKNEIEIQKDVYRKTLLNPTSTLYAACPSILHAENPVKSHQRFHDIICNPANIISRKRKIIPENEHERTIQEEIEEIEEFMNASNHVKFDKDVLHETMIDRKSFNELLTMFGSDPNNPNKFKFTTGLYSIVVMEFLENFEILGDIIKPENDTIKPENLKHLSCLIFHELEKIHKLNYYHNDLHAGNVMLNMKSPYYTLDTTQTDKLGRAIIIDFGRIMKYPNVKDQCSQKVRSDSRAVGAYTMMSSSCFNTVDLVSYRTIPNYDVAQMEVYRKQIKDVTSQRLMTEIIPKMLDKYPAISKSLLLSPEQHNTLSIKTIVDILTLYIEKTSYPVGGGVGDIDELLDVIIGCIMQNDTPETFNIMTLFNDLVYIYSDVPITVNVPISNIETDYKKPVLTYGGKKRRTTRRRSNKRKINKRKTSRRYKK